MKSKGVVFTSNDVDMLFNGDKTQFAIPVEYCAALGEPDRWCYWATTAKFTSIAGHFSTHCPVGKIGDQIWTQEPYIHGKCPNDNKGHISVVRDDADGYPIHCYGRLHPQAPKESIHWCRNWKRHPASDMPMWASCCILKIVDIKLCRMAELTIDDCIKQGVVFPAGNFMTPEGALCDEMRKQVLGWRKHPSNNPWLWVVEVEKV